MRQHVRHANRSSERDTPIFDHLEPRQLLGGDPFNFATTRPVLSTPDEMRTMATADINGDGHLDLIVAAGPRIYSLTNDGEGRFTQRSVFRVDGYVKELALGDFDGDGDTDLAAIGPNASGLSTLLRVFLGNNNGTFARSATIKVNGAIQIHSSNFDADTRRELLVVFEHGATIYQMNAGLPNAPRGLASVGFTIVDVAVGDMDFDGVSDVVVAANDPDTVKAGASVWYVRPASISIQGVLNDRPDARVTSIAIGNIVGSTRPDIIVAGRNLDGSGSSTHGVWYFEQLLIMGNPIFGPIHSIHTEAQKLPAGVSVSINIDIFAVRQINGDVANRRDIVYHWQRKTTNTNTKPETISYSGNVIVATNTNSAGAFSTSSGGFISPDENRRTVMLCAPFQTASPSLPDLLYIQLTDTLGGNNKARYAENFFPV
jgi:hypothetical protein